MTVEVKSCRNVVKSIAYFSIIFVKTFFMKFQEWFDNKLTVGKMPDDFFEDTYDYIINVSNEYQSLRPNNYFWFPMNECKRDIGVNSIYGALIILEKAHTFNKSVYLHCHAGINRSQTVRCAFYYMKTGRHIELAYGSFTNVLIKNCSYGYLPNLIEMQNFLLMLNQDMEISLDRLKLKTLLNF